MATISKAQAALLVDGFLDRQAQGLEAKTSINEVPLITELLLQYGKAFIEAANNNLIESNSIDTGALSRDLVMQVEYDNTTHTYHLYLGYPINSKAAAYYDFVNKGVKGVKTGLFAPKSPYEFKTLNPSASMVKSIYRWVLSHAITSRNEDQKHNLTSLQQKRKSIGSIVKHSDSTRTISYVIARSIKARGLATTGYFDKAIASTFDKDFRQTMQDAVAKITGTQVNISISQLNNII